MWETHFVPVRTSKSGTLVVQTGRLRPGERVGLAFTSEAALLQAMGPSQQWIQLCPEVLTQMLAPLGVKTLKIDPCPADELGAGYSLVRRPAA